MSAKPVEPLHPFVERQSTGNGPASPIATATGTTPDDGEFKLQG
jgi:hypothetical protein